MDVYPTKKTPFLFLGGVTLVFLGLIAINSESGIAGYSSSASLETLENSNDGEFISTFQIIPSKHPLVFSAKVCLNTRQVGSDAFVAVGWRPLNSSLGWIQSQYHQLYDFANVSETCLDFDITRVRGNSAYGFNVLIKNGIDGVTSMVYTDIFTTETSGFAFFDRKFGKVNGTAFPSWQVITTSGEYVRDKVGFRGIFTMDAEGWVVWYHDSGEYTYVFDWLKNGHIVLLHAHTSNYKWPGSFMEIDIKGTMINNYTREECESLHTFGLLDHEMRVHSFDSDIDPYSGEYVISTLRTAENFENSPSYNASMYGGAEYFGGERIVLWKPSSGEVEYMYNMFDYLNPYRDVSSAGSGDGAYGSMKAYCTKRDFTDIVDYMHMNSVSISEYDNSFIVSFHSLSTIMSLTTNGTGVMWILSSGFAHLSTFKMKTTKTEFSGQHDVRQLPNGHLIFIDNKYKVKECKECTRAMEVRLDFETRVAECVWEHVIERRSLLGGSIRVPRTKKRGLTMKGPYVIAYTKLDTPDDVKYDNEEHYPSRVYEVYPNGTAASLLEIPAPAERWSASNYRALPSKGVSKEYDVDDTWNDISGYDYYN